jgi:hypothetical protein
MNKDEMIKDMVADYKCCYLCDRHYYNEDGSEDCIFHNSPEECECMYVAETLYNAGYRKIGEDEIVMSKEAYYEALNAAQESGKRIGYAKGRYETAREIFDEIITSLNSTKSLFDGNPNYNGVRCDIIKRNMSEIAYRYGIELERNL